MNGVDNVGIIFLMERRIEYAKTADGVSIAFWTVGEGMPLVYLTGGPWSHIELWQVPECRRWYGRLGQKKTLVRYDVRGTGLSEREVTDFSLDARVLDLEAVLDRLNLNRVNLFGAAEAGQVAITYAVRHPARVARLVLWCAWPKGSDISSPRIHAWRGLIDQDWELMTDTCVQLALGWSGSDVGRVAAEHLRDSVTRDVARTALAAIDVVDVTGLLPQVVTPTLVLHRREISWLPVDAARALSSHIPNARLVLLDGESTAPYLGDTEAAAAAIEEFLDTQEITTEVQWEAGVTPVPSTGVGAKLERSQSVAYPDNLTDREIQVLRLVAGGRTSKEVAAELVLSVRTIERHVENIYGKIGARNKANATAYALTRGIV
ncbi:MAG: alpha/beta fold hydrolase [Dehalococcoidia bacterium]